jgi:hypothetical protein
MTQFAILNQHAAKCLGVSKREEFHGDDLVDAMTVRLRITTSCMELDQWFGRQARLQWYEHKDTETMPGVEPVTTELRAPMFPGPHKMSYEGVGYLFSMRRGAGHSKALAVELSGADLKKFTLDPKQGGSCVLDFSVHVREGLDDETMGRINGMSGRDVEVMFAPPSVQDGTMPDSQAGRGKKSAKVHSAQGALIVDPAADGKPADPTGAFLDAHGEKPMSEEPSAGNADALAAAAIGRAKTKGRGPK